MDRYQHILGCLLGTALGDAVGLRREGLSRQRAMRMYGGKPLQPNLMLGMGLCSDDTEHTQMVGRAIVLSQGDVSRFELAFARELRRWMLAIPAGVGFATLKACGKLLLRVSPEHSGVFSAGNGPAMRSALIGVSLSSDEDVEYFVRSSTRITHTDPKALTGAMIVARAARVSMTHASMDAIEFVGSAARSADGSEMRDLLESATKCLKQGKTPVEFAETQGWSRGVRGYINHSVPAALYCWAHSPNDFRQCVENAVLLGGDTDTVAAITGAICGANLGADKLPADWIEALSEWPRNLEWMHQLADCLCKHSAQETTQTLPKMHWLATIPRNALFAAMVISLGFRRLLPP